MADTPTGFSIPTHLDPDLLETYVHNQGLAIDYLVTKGHITVNKTIKLKRNGLLYAEGEEDEMEDILRKEPCLPQGGADAALRQDSRSSLLESLLEAKPLKRMSTDKCYSTIMDILNNLPITAHPAWGTLAATLAADTASGRSGSDLCAKIGAACEEEELDWKAFEFFKKACENGPRYIHYSQIVASLFRLMGVRQGRPNTLCLLYGRAQFHDTETADTMLSLTALIQYIQISRSGESENVYPILRRKCRNLGELLSKNRVAPRLRRVMELYIDESAGNDIEVDNDDDHPEGLQPEKKRRRTRP
ncbi:hypothetical protein BBK36DRAFT_1157131 [Trichoderma citrinoviride]|uniref:Uncharacterized protein n=1 Tax=Trichoderma citrinoviride TaxID=58853 RepID=A0A2T4BHV0_9HYPO|nr:hypothetical protein BBK36DRAFT_1157131 [Trichoderma citrinoviride]PTB68893.1 hypothetical protein BBK36DRAFT_1157131 [Trichoderma citrinoviride]